MSATPHLDDELLSAHLDNEAPEAAEHVAACAECRGRRDDLRAAARLVGVAPPEPPAAVVDAAVGRALADGRRTTRRPVLVALAAAAMLVLGVVGVGVLDDGGGGGGDAVTALADQDADAGGGAGGPASVADGGDLGELDDAVALADTVRATVEPAPTTTVSPSGAVSDDAASEALEAPAGGGRAQLRSPTNTKSATKDPYCEQTVRRTYAEGLGALVYRATLRWEGTPAVALAYTLLEPRGELDHRVYVLATEDCRLLVAQTL